MATEDGLAVHRWSVWSTTAALVTTDHRTIVEATRTVQDVLERVDVVASRFRSDSEVMRLSRVQGRDRVAVTVSADLFELLAVALRAARLTDGAVDPTVGSALVRLGYDRDFWSMAADRRGPVPPPEGVPGWRTITLDEERSVVSFRPGTLLDLGATAKAWAADRAAAVVAARLECGVLVSLGGDLAVAGPVPPGGFAVGVADTCGEGTAQTTVAVTSGGMATSGTANRHWTVGGVPVHHVVDPRTGLPASSCWQTVTVAAASCCDANTASTAALVIGEGAVPWLEERNLPARLVRAGDGSVTTVGSWPAEPVLAGSDGRSGPRTEVPG